MDVHQCLDEDPVVAVVPHAGAAGGLAGPHAQVALFARLLPGRLGHPALGAPLLAVGCQLRGGPLAYRLAERGVFMVEDAAVDHRSGLPRCRLTQLFQRALLYDETLPVALRELRRTGGEARDPHAAGELPRAPPVGWEAH